MIKIHGTTNIGQQMPPPPDPIFNMQQHINYLSEQLTLHQNENKNQNAKFNEINSSNAKIEQENANLRDKIKSLTDKLELLTLPHNIQPQPTNNNYVQPTFQNYNQSPPTNNVTPQQQYYSYQPSPQINATPNMNPNNQYDSFVKNLDDSITNIVDSKAQLEGQIDYFQTIITDMNVMLDSKKEILKSLSKQTKCKVESLLNRQDRVMGNVIKINKYQNVKEKYAKSNDDSSVVTKNAKINKKLDKLERKINKQRNML